LTIRDHFPSFREYSFKRGKTTQSLCYELKTGQVT
jgi:hypothetical protein